jgi:hypothetical protein
MFSFYELLGVATNLIGSPTIPSGFFKVFFLLFFYQLSDGTAHSLTPQLVQVALPDRDGDFVPA